MIAKSVNVTPIASIINNNVFVSGSVFAFKVLVTVAFLISALSAILP